MQIKPQSKTDFQLWYGLPLVMLLLVMLTLPRLDETLWTDEQRTLWYSGAPPQYGPASVTETIGAVGQYGTDKSERLATFLDLDVLASEPTAGFDHFDASDAFAGKCSSDDSGDGGDAGAGGEEDEPSWGKGGKKKNN